MNINNESEKDIRKLKKQNEYIEKTLIITKHIFKITEKIAVCLVGVLLILGWTAYHLHTFDFKYTIVFNSGDLYTGISYILIFYLFIYLINIILKFISKKIKKKIDSNKNVV